MPGRRLNHTENALAGAWKRAAEFPYQLLRGLTIEGADGLRGIRRLDIEFRYPLTVLVGRNGTGKSTVLALAALAFHTVPGHQPVNALRRPRRGETSTYYTFSDFFFRGPGDAAASGVRIGWHYEGGAGTRTINVNRVSDRSWMKYERRPRRPVHFVGIARTVPAIERRVLRDHFAKGASADREVGLNTEYRGYLSRIMGRHYEEAAVLEARGYQLRMAHAPAAYSSFNMGAGEDVLIELLHLLQTTPDGSLVVIEEVELGLHPEAVRCFAEELQKIALRKKLQIVTSTHSAEFLDAVPREARVLVQLQGAGHGVYYEPSTRYAMGDLRGVPTSELVICCEDEFAASLIEGSLPGEARRRSRVVPVGPKQNLPDYAAYHLRSGSGEPLLLVWDGDVHDGEIRSWMTRLRREGLLNARVGWFRLPSTNTPEEWAIGVLQSDAGSASLADDLREPREEVLGRVADLRDLADGHDLEWALGQRFRRRPEEMRGAIVRAVSRAADQELRPMVEAIISSLTGELPRDPTIDEPDP